MQQNSIVRLRFLERGNKIYLKVLVCQMVQFSFSALFFSFILSMEQKNEEVMSKSKKLSEYQQDYCNDRKSGLHQVSAQPNYLLD